MIVKIFYSWQSDLDEKGNHYLIRDVLNQVVKDLQDEDPTLQLILDQDTRNERGSPNIVEVILRKIREAHIFVGDISLVNTSTESRPTPNPNVLIELGYALRGIDLSRIFFINNIAYGKPEHAPFDIRTNRIISYKYLRKEEDKGKEDKEKQVVQKTLAKGLKEDFSAIIKEIRTEQAQQQTEAQRAAEEQGVNQVIRAITDNRPDQTMKVRAFMEDLIERLKKQAPVYDDITPSDDILVAAIENTTDLVIEFSRVAEYIAGTSSYQAAEALYNSFGLLLDEYYVPKNFIGDIPYPNFNYYKFIAHELFVTFFAFLVRYEAWSTIDELLKKPFHISNPENDREGLFPYEYISQPVILLQHRKERLKLNKVSIHADLLEQRHSTGDLGSSVPLDIFMEADYLLFLRSSLLHDDWEDTWSPWSTLYIRKFPPRFIVALPHENIAKKILPALGVQDTETLKTRLRTNKPRISRVFGHSIHFDPLDLI